MFTGIIETMGTILELQKEGSNINYIVSSEISNELKIDQSLAHNGVCLTVTSVKGNTHQVTAIRETIEKSNMGDLQPGDKINLERALLSTQRLDGHFVQGHVDTVGICKKIKEEQGSWYFEFEYKPDEDIFLTVPKGSITVNGVSLTVVESKSGFFSVAIIPYTHENTNFHTFNPGTRVNLEFDILGKYMVALFNRRKTDK